ncbi:polysaccharide biosynthesis protein [Paenibacillus sp. ACRRX]|uniref:putative polysaccharide biosynthesis protein n=1 Tax=Paenibacillus sp. ACRRX TaxID=2918206 RepID=UPI001EF48630|nr:polysaccharide biosynthesis protein [Paenibacillus sp. ACRRX]MCG7410773.1 polysaccharide biosynthesis protein [Paenibacillus sp. ACRRX]
MTEQNLRTAKQVVHGALWLGLATAMSKLIGTLQKIPLQNIGGDGVFGIYNAVYPFYVLLTAIATAGIPIAVSRLVVDCEAVGDQLGSRHIIRASALLMGTTGIAGWILMYSGAELIAGWIDNLHTIEAIKASSYALLVVPLAAVLRGYDQGKGRTTLSAISQVAEQVVRVAVMITLLLIFTGQQAADDVIAAGATFGSFAGGLCGLVLLVVVRGVELRNERRQALAASVVSCEEKPAVLDTHVGLIPAVHSSSGNINALAVASGEQEDWRNHGAERAEGLASPSRESNPSFGTWMKRMAWTALPICLGAIVVPVVNVVDVFTVPRLLNAEGYTGTAAMIQYGLYSRALPLTQLVTMVAGSLAVGLVPALAEAKRKGSMREQAKLIKGAMRAALIIGAAATVGLVVLTRPINIALYMDNRAELAFALVSSTALAGVLQVVSATLLQGIGALRAPAVHLLAAAGAKIGLNIVLVPMFGIEGAALSALVSLTLAAALNVRSLARHGGVAPAAWAAGIARLALALFAMGAVAGLSAAVAQGIGGGRLAALAATAIGVPLGALVFGALAVMLGLVQPQELAAVPRIGTRLAALAERRKR